MSVFKVLSDNLLVKLLQAGVESAGPQPVALRLRPKSGHLRRFSPVTQLSNSLRHVTMDLFNVLWGENCCDPTLNVVTSICRLSVDAC
eukprot:scaffold51768_cov17-Prasinocladus_malaysianus.AAC.1